MATPALRELRRAFPEAEIFGVASPLIAEMLEKAWGSEAPWLDGYLLYHKSRRRATAKTVSRWRLPAHLKNLGLDAVLLLTNSFWSAGVAKLSETKTRVGYARDGRGWLLSDRLEPPRNEDGSLRPISAIDYYLALTDWMGCGDASSAQRRKMQLSVSEREREQADALWRKCGLEAELPTITLNSNAAKQMSRVWPAEKVSGLARRLVANNNCQVLIHCGPGERKAANTIAHSADHPRIASMGVTDDLPIGLTKSVLERSAVVVSTDSGPRHIAVALNRPVVSLFGSTQPHWTRTYNVPEIELSLGLECQPCYKSACPLGHHHCMEQLDVQRVLTAVESQLNFGQGNSEQRLFVQASA